MRHANRFPDHLDEEDRRTYRRWIGGLFLTYGTVIAIAIGMLYFHQPSGDLRATNDIRMARLKPASNPAVDLSSSAPTRH